MRAARPRRRVGGAGAAHDGHDDRSAGAVRGARVRARPGARLPPRTRRDGPRPPPRPPTVGRWRRHPAPGRHAAAHPVASGLRRHPQSVRRRAAFWGQATARPWRPVRSRNAAPPDARGGFSPTASPRRFPRYPQKPAASGPGSGHPAGARSLPWRRGGRNGGHTLRAGIATGLQPEPLRFAKHSSGNCRARRPPGCGRPRAVLQSPAASPRAAAIAPRCAMPDPTAVPLPVLATSAIRTPSLALPADECQEFLPDEGSRVGRRRGTVDTALFRRPPRTVRAGFQAHRSPVGA